MCEWLHPKDQCVGSGFLFLVSRDDPVRTNKSTFCLIVLLFQAYFILFWYWPVSSRKRGFSRKWKSKVVEKKISVGKKIDKHTFFPVKIKVIDLWMQIEVRKLIFVVNFSVLDFFKFASRMPQTTQIFVWTFKIFRGSMPPGPPRYFLLFFSLAILRIWVLKFLFFSNWTQSDFPLVVAFGLKSMLYLYQNIFYCCTRIYIFYRSIPTDCSCQIIRDFCKYLIFWAPEWHFQCNFENSQVNVWSKRKACWLANIWFSCSRMLVLWWHTEKTFSFWGRCPQTPTRGFAPGPHWGPTAAPRPPHHFPPFSLFPSPMSA